MYMAATLITLQSLKKTYSPHSFAYTQLPDFDWQMQRVKRTVKRTQQQ